VAPAAIDDFFASPGRSAQGFEDGERVRARQVLQLELPHPIPHDVVRAHVADPFAGEQGDLDGPRRRLEVHEVAEQSADIAGREVGVIEDEDRGGLRQVPPEEG